MKFFFTTSFAILLCAASLPFARAAGAPPNGYTSVATTKSLGDSNPSYGVDPRMTLDSNGDPQISFLWLNPSGDGSGTDTSLYFSGWNRSLSQFNPPVKVAVTGDVEISGALVPISMARDASDNLLGIAYLKELTASSELHIALSTDNGATWKDQTVVTATNLIFYSPSLGMANGNVFLAFVANFDGVRYMTGKETDAPTLWTTTHAPLQSGYSGFRAVVSLALDSNNAPALTYLAVSDSSADFHLLFWRPGSPSPTLISGTQNQGTDGPDIKLSFFGTQPRVAFAGAMDKNYFADYNHALWAMRSTDGGATWSSPINIPADGQNSLDAPIWLASGSQGQGAIVSYSNGGSGGGQCNAPKLSTSDNTFAKWTTCGPTPVGQPSSTSLIAAAAYGPGDRLYIAFQEPQGYDLPYGVVLWSQTVAGGNAPAINSGGIVHGASFLPPVSPGALATIFGTGYLESGTGATAVPLPTTLKTPTSTLSVTVNGVNAPLNYANPTQINFQVPWEAVPGTANVVVTVNGVNSNTAPMNVISAAPGIFVYQNNLAVAQDSNYALIGNGAVAVPGGTIIVYMTGSGPVKPTPATGAASGSGDNLAYVQASVSATVGVQPAQVVFAGMAPGFVGLLQVNLVVPAGLTPGNYPLTVTINGQKSNSPTLIVGNQ